MKRITKRRMFPALCLLGAAAFGQEKAPENFWLKFQPAYESGSEEAMKKVVAADPQGATQAFLERVERFAVEMEDELGRQVDALRKAWEGAFHNQFFENEYKYLSLLDANGRKRRRELIGQWGQMHVLFESTRGTSKEENWAALEKNLPVIVESLEALGDLYHGSLAAYKLAQAHERASRPKGGNDRIALEHFKKFLEMRDRLDLKDGLYNQVKQIVERLEKLYQPLAPGEEPGEGEAIPYKPGAQWTSFGLSAATAELAGDVERFAYDGDEVTHLWSKVQIQGNKPAPFPNFPSVVNLVREGPSKFSLDHDGDGKGDAKLKAVGKPELVEFPRQFGGFQDKYALWITTAGTQVQMQRVEVNLAPSNETANFYYRSASVRSGVFQEILFRFFDENADGRFNTEVLERPVEGDEKPIPWLDAWTIGKDKRAAPASAYAKFGDKWYRVEFDKKTLGQEVRLREVIVHEGALAVDFKGPASMFPAFLIVKAVGTYQGAYFDIAANKKGVTVPAGGYEILYGLVRMGKGQRVQKAAILRGKSKGVAVEEGKTTTLRIGEPYSFDFSWRKNGDKIELQGKTVVVYGAGGESYEYIWDEVPTPEVQAGVGGKPAGKPSDTRRASQEDLNKKNDWAILWHPLDLELDPPKGEGVQLRLSEKHKWFGKIDSPWK